MADTMWQPNNEFRQPIHKKSYFKIKNYKIFIISHVFSNLQFEFF